MTHPYPSIEKVPDRPRGNAEVRKELRQIQLVMEMQRCYHADRWAEDDGHPEPCKRCERMKAEQIGILNAIRHFGGKPRLPSWE